MIRLEVEPYCQECQDFEADVDGKKIELLTCSDTVIRCKYRNRCRRLSEYLKRQKGEENANC